jgi:hypothetical protein
LCPNPVIVEASTNVSFGWRADNACQIDLHGVPHVLRGNVLAVVIIEVAVIDQELAALDPPPVE